MNARFELWMTKPEFRRWADAPERSRLKFEWAGGRVVQMANVTRRHSRIVSNVMRAISARLDLDVWAVVATDFNVETDTFVRTPDVMVEPAEGDPKALGSDRAIILVEVLSASSVKVDFVDKLGEYTTLPTLEAYLVVSQDEPMCWLWQRQANGTFAARSEDIQGLEQGIALAARGITIPLSEIYRGIAFG